MPIFFNELINRNDDAFNEAINEDYAHKRLSKIGIEDPKITLGVIISSILVDKEIYKAKIESLAKTLFKYSKLYFINEEILRESVRNLDKDSLVEVFKIIRGLN